MPSNNAVRMRATSPEKALPMSGSPKASEKFAATAVGSSGEMKSTAALSAGTPGKAAAAINVKPVLRGKGAQAQQQLSHGAAANAPLLPTLSRDQQYNQVLEAVGQASYQAMKTMFFGTSGAPEETIPEISVSFELFEAVQNRLKTMKANLDQANEDLHARNVQYTQVQSELQTAQEANTALQQQVKETEAANLRLRQEMTEMEAAQQQMEQLILQWESENEALQRQLQERERECEVIESRVAEGLVALTRKDTVIENLKRELQRLAGYYQAARKAETGESGARGGGTPVGGSGGANTSSDGRAAGIPLEKDPSMGMAGARAKAGDLYAPMAMRLRTEEIETRSIVSRYKITIGDLENEVSRLRAMNTSLVKQQAAYRARVEAVVTAYEVEAMGREDGFASHKCVENPFFAYATLPGYPLLPHFLREEEGGARPAPPGATSGGAAVAYGSINTFSLLYPEVDRVAHRMDTLMIDSTSVLADGIYKCRDAQQSALRCGAEAIRFLSVVEGLLNGSATLTEVREQWSGADIPLFTANLLGYLMKSTENLSAAFVSMLKSEQNMTADTKAVMNEAWRRRIEDGDVDDVLKARMELLAKNGQTLALSQQCEDRIVVDSATQTNDPADRHTSLSSGQVSSVASAATLRVRKSTPGLPMVERIEVGVMTDDYGLLHSLTSPFFAARDPSDLSLPTSSLPLQLGANGDGKTEQADWRAHWHEKQDLLLDTVTAVFDSYEPMHRLAAQLHDLVIPSTSPTSQAKATKANTPPPSTGNGGAERRSTAVESDTTDEAKLNAATHRSVDVKVTVEADVKILEEILAALLPLLSEHGEELGRRRASRRLTSHARQSTSGSGWSDVPEASGDRRKSRGTTAISPARSPLRRDGKPSVDFEMGKRGSVVGLKGMESLSGSTAQRAGSAGRRLKKASISASSGGGSGNKKPSGDTHIGEYITESLQIRAMDKLSRKVSKAGSSSNSNPADGRRTGANDVRHPSVSYRVHPGPNLPGDDDHRTEMGNPARIPHKSDVESRVDADGQRCGSAQRQLGGGEGSDPMPHGGSSESLKSRDAVLGRPNSHLTSTSWVRANSSRDSLRLSRATPSTGSGIASGADPDGRRTPRIVSASVQGNLPGTSKSGLFSGSGNRPASQDASRSIDKLTKMDPGSTQGDQTGFQRILSQLLSRWTHDTALSNSISGGMSDGLADGNSGNSITTLPKSTALSKAIMEHSQQLKNELTSSTSASKLHFEDGRWSTVPRLSPTPPGLLSHLPAQRVPPHLTSNADCFAATLDDRALYPASTAPKQNLSGKKDNAMSYPGTVPSISSKVTSYRPLGTIGGKAIHPPTDGGKGGPLLPAVAGSGDEMIGGTQRPMALPPVLQQYIQSNHAKNAAAPRHPPPPLTSSAILWRKPLPPVAPAALKLGNAGLAPLHGPIIYYPEDGQQLRCNPGVVSNHLLLPGPPSQTAARDHGSPGGHAGHSVLTVRELPLTLQGSGAVMRGQPPMRFAVNPPANEAHFGYPTHPSGHAPPASGGSHVTGVAVNLQSQPPLPPPQPRSACTVVHPLGPPILPLTLFGSSDSPPPGFHGLPVHAPRTESPARQRAEAASEKRYVHFEWNFDDIRELSTGRPSVSPTTQSTDSAAGVQRDFQMYLVSLNDHNRSRSRASDTQQDVSGLYIVGIPALPSLWSADAVLEGRRVSIHLQSWRRKVTLRNARKSALYSSRLFSNFTNGSYRGSRSGNMYASGLTGRGTSRRPLENSSARWLASLCTAGQQPIISHRHSRPASYQYQTRESRSITRTLPSGRKIVNQRRISSKYKGILWTVSRLEMMRRALLSRGR